MKEPDDQGPLFTFYPRYIEGMADQVKRQFTPKRSEGSVECLIEIRIQIKGITGHTNSKVLYLILEKQAFQRRENSIVEGVVAMSLHKITTVLFPLSVCMVLSYYLI